jgi:RNA polymerase sigma-70 factor (ECF subfamily)
VINEVELIASLKTESTREKAYYLLVDTYKERLYWHIRKIVITHDDADDVLQNTFIKIFRNIDSFKGDSKLFSWMYRIATNESITFLNQKAKQLQLNSEELISRKVNQLQSDVYFEGDAIQLKLQQAIATLPQKQQLVFNMKYFDDITFKTMADILETSEGALKTSYHIAKQKIEKFLLQD